MICKQKTVARLPFSIEQYFKCNYGWLCHKRLRCSAQDHSQPFLWLLLTNFVRKVLILLRLILSRIVELLLYANRSLITGKAEVNMLLLRRLGQKADDGDNDKADQHGEGAAVDR